MPERFPTKARDDSSTAPSIQRRSGLSMDNDQAAAFQLVFDNFAADCAKSFDRLKAPIRRKPLACTAIRSNRWTSRPDQGSARINHMTPVATIMACRIRRTLAPPENGLARTGRGDTMLVLADTNMRRDAKVTTPTRTSGRSTASTSRLSPTQATIIDDRRM